MADNWLKNNPTSSWDRDGLVDLWKGKYQDLSAIPGMMNQYAHEFANGIVPSNFQYNPNSLYGDARTGAVAQTPLYPGATATPVSATVSNTVNQPDSNYLNDSNWVGKVFPGAQWNNASRTITVGDGRVLREGTDFVIKNNRAYVLPGVSANVTPNLPPNLIPNPVPAPVDTGKRDQDLFETTNRYIQAALDARKEFADYPAYTPPAREEFRFITPPPSITSTGDDIHIPTLAALKQWDEKQDAIQDQYSKKYETDYDRNKDLYDASLELIKLGKADQEKREEIAREAAISQQEREIAAEKEKWNRAWTMLEAGVPNAEVYALLGIVPGTKTLTQILKEKQMDLDEKEHALDVAKAARSGGTGGSRGTGGSGGGTVYVPPNPFQDTGGGEKGATIRGYKVTRLDEYISTQRARLKTPEAVAEYVKNTKLLNSDFKQAVLTRLNHHLAS